MVRDEYGMEANGLYMKDVSQEHGHRVWKGIMRFKKIFMEDIKLNLG